MSQQTLLARSKVVNVDICESYTASYNVKYPLNGRDFLCDTLLTYSLHRTSSTLLTAVKAGHPGFLTKGIQYTSSIKYHVAALLIILLLAQPSPTPPNWPKNAGLHAAAFSSGRRQRSTRNGQAQAVLETLYSMLTSPAPSPPSRIMAWNKNSCRPLELACWTA